MKKTLTIISALVFLSGCFPEDTIVPPHEPGDLQVGTVSVGTDYRYQSFYDLNTNREVTMNHSADWDLAFESSTNGHRIILNSAKNMYAGNSYDTLFENVISEEGVKMKFDQSDGNPDSTAIGEWYEIIDDTLRSKKEVYIIDRVLDHNGQLTGYKKVQFDIEGDFYVIRHADLDNQNDTVYIIQRDPERNFTCFSFEEGIVEIEPAYNEWSLKFSKYTTMLQTNEGENYPYPVFGALINPYKMAAALDTIHEFSEIVLKDTIDLDLTGNWDVIGYDWKYYNFSQGVYTIVPGYAYVIRDRDGYYYKLRFIDFYNDTGEKGNPEFEFIRL